MENSNFNESNPPLPIGEIIKIRRTELKLTQKEFAKRLNVSHQMVSKWESVNDFRIMQISTLEKISKALELSLSELLHYTDITLEEEMQMFNPYTTIDTFLFALGYIIEDDAENALHSIIHYSGYNYKIPYQKELLYQQIEDVIRHYMDKLMIQFQNTKSSINNSTSFEDLLYPEKHQDFKWIEDILKDGDKRGLAKSAIICLYGRLITEYKYRHSKFGNAAIDYIDAKLKEGSVKLEELLDIDISPSEGEKKYKSVKDSLSLDLKKGNITLRDFIGYMDS